MNDEMTNKDFEDADPEEDHSNGRERPQDRFRRLIGADFDEDEAAGEKADEGLDALEDTPHPVHPANPSGRTGPWVSELDEEYLDHLQQTQVSEPDADVPEPSVPLARHPTGAPEQTGGWYYDEAGKPVASTLSMPVIPEEPVEDIETPYVFQMDAATVPPDQEITPPVSKPLVPMKVDETDMDATRVTPAAYRPAVPEHKPLAKPGSHSQPVPVSKPAPISKPVSRSTKETETIIPAPMNNGPDTESVRTSRKRGNGNMGGCLARVGIALLFIGIFIAVVFFSFGIYKYFAIVNADDFPDVKNLYANASQFETTTILDRNGNTLYEIVDPNAGRRTYVRLDQISPYMIASLLATEDKEFYNNPGYDPMAMLRAIWQNRISGETVSGASTITQQLARILLLSPEERYKQDDGA